MSTMSLVETTFKIIVYDTCNNNNSIIYYYYYVAVGCTMVH